MSTDWPITKIDDHQQRALDRLVEQDRSAENFRKIIDKAAERYQGLEEVGYSLLTERNIFDAVGAQLDGIGQIVGEPRLGKSDGQYREALLERIGLNRASGEPESVITFIISLTGATRVIWRELYPANVQVFVSETITLQEAQRIRRLMPAAVGAVFIESTDGENPFGMSGVNEDPDEDSLGFGELGFHILDLGGGEVLDIGDNAILGVTDHEDPLYESDGGRMAELFEV